MSEINNDSVQQQAVSAERYPNGDDTTVQKATPKTIEAPSLQKKKAEDFTFGKVIGSGSYSEVVLAHEKFTGDAFAIKILEKSHIIKHKKVPTVTREKEVVGTDLRTHSITSLIRNNIWDYISYHSVTTSQRFFLSCFFNTNNALQYIIINKTLIHSTVCFGFI